MTLVTILIMLLIPSLAGNLYFYRERHSRLLISGMNYKLNTGDIIRIHHVAYGYDTQLYVTRIQENVSLWMKKSDLMKVLSRHKATAIAYDEIELYL